MNPLAPWITACAHVNGLALASTVEALHRQGLLSALARPAGLCPGPDVRGALLGAVHLLELLGWVRRADSGAYHLTERGRAAQHLTPAFAVVPGLLRQARLLLECDDPDAPASRDLLDLVDQCQARWGLTPAPSELPADLVSWFIQALDGHLAAPALALFHALGGVVALEPRPIRADSVLDAIARALQALGWVHRQGQERSLRFTPGGLVALGMVGTYGHALAYLPMLEQVPAALFSEVPWPAAAPGQAERHVDRARDVAVSGEVFSKFVAVPFLEIFLPAFDVEALADQPRAIVDVGCGDASMLVALGEAVRSRTLRGRHLDAFPLEIIGIDFHEAARAAATRTLRKAGLPYRVLPGDIGDPAGLARELADLGLASRDCVFVCKSVIHNRSFVSPARSAPTQPARLSDRPASLVHLTREGRLIPEEEVEQDLLEFFRRWLPHVHPHGLVAAEAHAVDSATVVAHLHRTLAPALEATHLFSGQLLVEMPTYHRAAEQAGFVSRERRTLGRAVLGHDYMSIDHFVPAP